MTPDPEAAAGPDPLPPEEAEVLEVDAPHTGVSVVDDVLASLDGLERRPVAERVQAFEQLQQGLRGALDEDPDPAPGDSAGA